MTVRRSHSSGFAAPPTSLRLSTWTLACSADPPPGRLPFRLDTAPELSLTLEDLVRVPVRASRSAHGGLPFFASTLPWGSSPLRRSQPGESLSRCGVFPRPLPPALAAGGWPVVPSRLTPRRFRRTSSRGSTPAKIRLRRFSRPWRFAPPRTLWRISATHALEVWCPCSPPICPSTLARGPQSPDAGGGLSVRGTPGWLRAAGGQGRGPVTVREWNRRCGR
jgi:hypothetical protein